jgi:hypothetical protein
VSAAMPHPSHAAPLPCRDRQPATWVDHPSPIGCPPRAGRPMADGPTDPVGRAGSSTTLPLPVG